MKIIITESQYRKVSLLRRLGDMMDVASDIIDEDNNFYGDLDFCRYYPTYQKYVKSMVDDITEHYQGFNYDYDIDDVSDFIYKDIGYENFVNLLMDEHGAKIRNYYNLKTKDC